MLSIGRGLRIQLRFLHPLIIIIDLRVLSLIVLCGYTLLASSLTLLFPLNFQILANIILYTHTQIYYVPLNLYISGERKRKRERERERERER